jgi:hypothetical protein
MHPFGSFYGFENGLVLLLVNVFNLIFLFEFHEGGLVDYHLVGGEEGADQATAGIEYLGDKGIAWQL